MPLGKEGILMDKRSRKFSTASLLYCVTFSASIYAAFPALAQSIPYECSLSGSASGNLDGCANSLGGGFRTAATSLKTDGSCVGSFCGAKSDVPSAVLPIEAWNVCRWVDNTSSNSIFVPFKTAQEWQQFRDAAPGLMGGSVGLVHCAVPYADNSAPSALNITPPFAGCTDISVATPNVYGRTGVSLYPDPSVAGPAFTCHAGATSMMSQVQWKAGDVESVGAGTLSWNTNFLYSPDMTLTADQVVIDYGNTVNLSWVISPYVGGEAVACSVSPGGWGPDAAGNPRSGTTGVALVATTTFTLTCTEGPSLTSVASVTVNVNPPPPPPPPPGDGTCCSDGGDGGDGGGDGGGG